MSPTASSSAGICTTPLCRRTCTVVWMRASSAPASCPARSSCARRMTPLSSSIHKVTATVAPLRLKPAGSRRSAAKVTPAITSRMMLNGFTNARAKWCHSGARSEYPTRLAP